MPHETRRSRTTSSGNNQPTQENLRDSDPPNLGESLENLRTNARAGQHVGPICGAYQSVHDAAVGMEPKQVYALVYQTLTRQEFDIVISAFSHFHCFMCQDGIVQCETCKGKGMLDDTSACPQCHGFAITACPFCGGTAWVEDRMIPEELEDLVLKRRIRHIDKAIKSFAKLASMKILQRLRDGPAQRRQRAAGVAIQLAARLEKLATQVQPQSPDKTAQFTSTARKVIICLKQLMPLHPTDLGSEE